MSRSLDSEMDPPVGEARTKKAGAPHEERDAFEMDAASETRAADSADADGDAKLRRRAWFWEFIGLAIVLFLGVLIIGALAAVTSAKEKKIKEAYAAAAAQIKNEPIPVAVMNLETVEVVDSNRLPGLIQALSCVSVPAEVTARLQVKKAVEGQLVKKDEVLAELDPGDFKIHFEKAESTLKLAQETFRRTSNLAKQGYATNDDMDREQNALKQAQKEYDSTKRNLDRCVIRSPMDGIVEDVINEIGEFVPAGSRVARVLDISRVKVEIGIPERDVDAVRNLKECDLIVTSIGDGLRVKGQKTFLSMEPMQGTLVYRLRLEVDNQDGCLRPGMFVEADVVKARRQNSIMVPLFSVLTDNEGYYVYVAEPVAGAEVKEGGYPAVARKRTVKLGVMQGSYVEAVSGLKAGDPLIVVGQRFVGEGREITVARSGKTLSDFLR